jgi:hypothetical protein
VVTTYFNWNEIYSKSRKDNAAIIILAFAQTTLYNEIYSSILMKKLNIHHIPQFMFKDKILEQKKQQLICNYRTQDAQSYFKNPKFLLANVPAIDKVVYLRALSLRRISDRSDRIPRDFFKKLEYNPFMTIEKDYINFTYESSFSRTS